jgi:large subunit ribosomal protein L9
MPQGPIRMAGEHKVEIHLHTDVNAEVTVTVIAEE